MRGKWPVQVVVFIGLCLLGAPLMRFIERPAPRPRPSLLIPILRDRTRSERALRAAWFHRNRAHAAVNLEREAVMAVAPPDAEAMDTDGWRQVLMARDSSGDLRQARADALRAAALAQSPGERYRAAALLARIECDRGRHRSELEQARLMVRLDPRNWQSDIFLRRALECNGWKVSLAAASPAAGEESVRRTPPTHTASPARADETNTRPIGVGQGGNQ